MRHKEYNEFIDRLAATMSKNLSRKYLEDAKKGLRKYKNAIANNIPLGVVDLPSSMFKEYSDTGGTVRVNVSELLDHVCMEAAMHIASQRLEREENAYARDSEDSSDCAP